MNRLLSALIALSLSACSAPVSDHQKTTDPATISVPFQMEIEQATQGPWTFTLSLNEPQKALIFSRSRHDYRRDSWTVLTPGVKLERIGGFDTILLGPDVKKAEFSFQPYTETLPGTYTHFIPFSNGAMAMYLDGFELLRIDGEAEAVTALEGSLSNWDGEQFKIPLALKSPERVLYQGNSYVETLDVAVHGGEQSGYAYLGAGDIIEGESFSGVLDPNLPDWLSDGLDTQLLDIFSSLEDKFGYGLTEKASILFAFRGYETDGFSNTGGVLSGGQIVLETSGSAMKTPNARLKAYLRWFLMHESAHLFQTAKGHSYENREDSWLLEGSANAMTYILLEDSGDAPNQKAVQESYQSAWADCIAAIQGVSMVEITERNDQSHYACGVLVFSIADAGLADQDSFDLWAKLIARAEVDKTVNTDDFFALLRETSLDDNVVQRLQDFVAGPVEDPETALLSLFEAVGIKTEFTGGTLTEINFPT